MAELFSPYVQERLGWYVYALVDPRDHEVFYVGKGQGNRVFDHGADADSPEAVETPKISRIQEIEDAGFPVKTMIVRHGLASSKHAYDVEAALIDVLGVSRPGTLLNAVFGHHRSTRGLVHSDVVASLFEAPRAPDITEPTIVFRVSQLWTPQMTSDELYEATRGWWKLGDRRNKAKYAFGVNKGVIRERMSSTRGGSAAKATEAGKTTGVPVRGGGSTVTTRQRWRNSSTPR
jgi:hypothetical protein